MKYLLLIGTIFLFHSLLKAQNSVIVSGQQEISTKGIAKEQRKFARRASKKIPPFDINYFYNSENRHIILELSLQDSQLNPIQAEIALGKPPYHGTGGNVEVIYYDNETEVGRYRLTDPTLGRSCDSIPRGIIPIQDQVSVYLSLPLDRDITRIAIVGSSISRQRPLIYDIGTLIQQAE